jgi:hypothetical protein
VTSSAAVGGGRLTQTSSSVTVGGVTDLRKTHFGTCARFLSSEIGSSLQRLPAFDRRFVRLATMWAQVDVRGSKNRDCSDESFRWEEVLVNQSGGPAAKNKGAGGSL